MLNRKRARGFTLIELTIVAAIIGVLGAIAIPRFGDLIVKAQESSVKGKLGVLRSAINIYYADTEGDYPTDLDVGLDLYLDDIPSIYIPAVKSMGNPGHFSDDIIETDEPLAIDTGAWIYQTSDGSIAAGNQRIKKGKGKALGWLKKGGPKLKYINVTPYGYIYIDCTHKDTTGTIWSTY